MRRIGLDAPPASLAEEHRQGILYEHLSCLDEVRKALHVQQLGLCGYCERPVRPPDAPKPHGTRIEHFHPRSLKTGTRVCELRAATSEMRTADTAWRNMLLSCGDAPTCDLEKGSTHICDTMLNPKTVPADVDSLLAVESDGTVRAREFLPAGAQEVVDTVVNLNHKPLVAARRRLLAELKQAISPRTPEARANWTPAKKRNAADALRRRAMSRGVAFPSVYFSLATDLEQRAARNS